MVPDSALVPAPGIFLSPRLRKDTGAAMAARILMLVTLMSLLSAFTDDLLKKLLISKKNHELDSINHNYALSRIKPRRRRFTGSASR
jgi:hypothetical protein